MIRICVKIGGKILFPKFNFEILRFMPCNLLPELYELCRGAQDFEVTSYLILHFEGVNKEKSFGPPPPVFINAIKNAQ